VLRVMETATGWCARGVHASRPLPSTQQLSEPAAEQRGRGARHDAQVTCPWLYYGSALAVGAGGVAAPGKPRGTNSGIAWKRAASRTGVLSLPLPLWPLPISTPAPFVVQRC
jgi:hypothetical protein